MADDWNKILQEGVKELVKMLIKAILPWAVKTAETAIEGAYNIVEEWVKNLGNKPAPEAKMAAAAALLVLAEPMSGAKARLLLEAHHIKTSADA